MTIDRSVSRIRHMKAAIADINTLLDGKNIEFLVSERFALLAFERLLEIISEASRGIPDEWKEIAGPSLPWRRIADLGNHLRHGYDGVEIEILWNVYEDHLGALENAVDEMLAKHLSDR